MFFFLCCKSSGSGYWNYVFIFVAVKAVTWHQLTTMETSGSKHTLQWPFVTSERCLASGLMTIWYFCFPFIIPVIILASKVGQINLVMSHFFLFLTLIYSQYSLCNEQLIELSNSGASGSLFYVSRDDEFIIKTVQHKEAEFLQKLLPGYFMVRLNCKESQYRSLLLIQVAPIYCSVI